MLTQDELLFFQNNSQRLMLYEQLKKGLLSRYPCMFFQTGKTQISLKNRFIFAAVSLPRRKGEPGLLLTLGLGTQLASSRVTQSVQLRPGRWTHHIPVAHPEELDQQLWEWLDAAWSFALNK